MSDIMKQIAKDFSLTKNDYYKHTQSGKWILKKEAIEKIADEKGILLESVQILNSERDFVRFLITMSMGDLRMSSIGEADSVNCRGNKYFGCMAEKRGIGRVVLRLIGASKHGIMSEDDFSNQVDKSFEEPTHSKPSKSNGEVSEDSPPSASPAWREKKFSPLDVKIKNVSRDDVIYWFKNSKLIKDEEALKLIEKEFEYRSEQAKKNKGSK